MTSDFRARLRRLTEYRRRYRPGGTLDVGEELPPAEWVALVRAWEARPNKERPVAGDEWEEMIEAARSAPADLDELEVRTDGY